MLVSLINIFLQVTPGLNSTADAITIVTGVISIITTIIAIGIYIKNRRLRGWSAQLRKLNPNLQVLPQYSAVWKKMTAIITNEQKQGNAIILQNIGLDLEKIVPDIIDLLENSMENKTRINFTYHALIINPDSAFISPLINGSSNIRTQYVHGSLEKISYMIEKAKKVSGIDLQVRSYDFPPSLHGMLINDKHLFLGFTEFKEGKIFGSDRPYLYLQAVNVPASEHYFKFFRDWFTYYWNYGK